MVILGLEKPVEYGSRQIFDPTMANMVLNAQNRYVQAMKEDYLQGREDLKEFNKNFGDFFSPIQKDMEWYDQNVTGATRDLINNLYAQGMDMRNPEFRAAVSKFINNMPVGKINQLKQSAEAAKEYLKNKGVLEAEGKWDPEFERFANNGLTLDNWDTAKNGMWTRTSPAELKTLKELTEDWYNNRTPEILNQQDVESFNVKYDPRYDYTGFADRHLLDIAAGETPGWNGSLYSNYYRELARRKVAAKGQPYTQEDVEKQLQSDIATANREFKALNRDENQFALDDHRTANDIGAARAKAAIEFEYDKKRLTDPVFKAAARAAGGGGGRKDDKFDPNIFREAEALAPKTSPAHTPWGTKAGAHVGYIPSGQYRELIDPVLPAAYVIGKDKDTGQEIEKFKFHGPAIKDRLYAIDEYGNVKKRRFLDKGGNSTSFEFIPDGQMKAAPVGNGSYRYYISGQIQGNNSDSFARNEDNGSTQVWIEVKERAFVYDGK